jgi:hypothetical protein
MNAHHERRFSLACSCLRARECCIRFRKEAEGRFRLIDDWGVDGDGTCAMSLQLAAKVALK